MTINDKLQDIAGLAKRLECYREQCREAGGIADEDGNLNAPMLAWWEACDTYLAEMAYIDGLMDVYGEGAKGRRLVRLLYYEGLSWEQTVRRLHCTEDQARTLHDSTICRIEESRRWEQMDIEDTEGA
jgi:hypothetical protein